jgi:hypothetical protein
VPTLPPTNVGLIGALHERGEREDRGPSARGGRQYRERPERKIFHSRGRVGADGKSPALDAFSALPTPAVPRFSTSVEDFGDFVKIPANLQVFTTADASGRGVEWAS